MKLKYSLIAIIITATLTSFENKPKEIDIPCKKEGLSDSQHFRASGSAKSRDMASAKDKSLLIAKQTLASLINSTIQSVSNNYTSSTSEKNSFKEIFETIIRETVNQQLKNVSITCQKVNQTKEGYEVFTAVEMSKIKLIDAISTSIGSDESLKSSFDEQKFRDIFEAEMKNISNELEMKQ
ncbi:MAG: hypothetical protein N2662_08725 [Bacteroidales bacterium]|nr:hypothetical protein [Bacteroidales bacterium]